MTTQPNDSSTSGVERPQPPKPRSHRTVGDLWSDAHPHRISVDVHRGAGGVVEIRVFGELDMVGAPLLRERINEEMPRCRALVLDLGGVDFLGTAGLSILLEAAQQAEHANVRWGIVASRHAVTHPLQAVGLRDVLPIHPSVAVATHAVTRSRGAS